MLFKKGPKQNKDPLANIRKEPLERARLEENYDESF